MTRDATLQGDLGAESIDFLDIVFRLERNFGIKIPRGELFPENLMADPEWVADGKLTTKGVEELKTRLPYRRHLEARGRSLRRQDRRPLHRRDARSICSEQARGVVDALGPWSVVGRPWETTPDPTLALGRGCEGNDLGPGEQRGPGLAIRSARPRTTDQSKR